MKKWYLCSTLLFILRPYYLSRILVKLKIVGPQGDLYMLGNCNDTWKLIRIPILEIFFLFHIMCSPTEWIFMTRLRQTVRQHVMASWFCLSSFCLLICRKLELGMVTWKYDHRKYYVDKVCDHLKLILLLVHKLSHIMKFIRNVSIFSLSL